MNQHVADLLKRLHGMDMAKFDDSFLKSSLEKRMAETHCVSDKEYCALLERDQSECGTFADSLLISYSTFFRNPLTCAVLERIVLPTLVLKKKRAKSKELRLWSAACAGGEEAYTLAILLEELAAGNENFTYRIFATDQSDVQINKARKGEFAVAALENLSLKRAGEWFTRQGDLHTVRPELKKHIDFSTFDLFSDTLSCPSTSIFGDFDLVVCANLLFYYKDDYRKAILAKTGNCLADGGYLISGETERDIVMRSDYREMYSQAAIFIRNLP
ncbi:MAG: CheR family methyltransferase [Pedobacter sp.]